MRAYFSTGHRGGSTLALLALCLGAVLPAAAQAPRPAAPAARPATQQQSSFLKAATPMPMARAFHGTAVLRDFLYVFGGSTFAQQRGDIPTNTCLVARIYPDGRLSQWVATTPMPEPRHYINCSTLVLNETVYVIGGSEAISDGKRINTVAWNRPRPNGMLGEWQLSKPFGEAGLSCVAAFAAPGHLYFCGGLKFDGTVSNQVWRVAILEDGSLGDWEESEPLPKGLWFHNAAVVGGRVWVFGGLTADDDPDTTSEEVFSASVLANGYLGAWREEPTRMTTPIYSASTATAGSFVFAFMPRYKGGATSNDVWFTQVTPKGMNPWRKQVTTAPIKIYHAVAPDYRRGSIYLPGGKPEKASDPSTLTYFFRLSEGARRQAETDWMASEAAHLSVSTANLFSRTPEPPGAAGATPAPEATLAIPGFIPYEKARNEVQGIRPLAVYFHNPSAKPCIDQNTALQAAEFQALTVASAFTAVDVKEYPQLAQQYGVFRVPTWIFYDRTGDETKRDVRKLTLDELKGIVQGKAN